MRNKTRPGLSLAVASLNADSSLGGQDVPDGEGDRGGEQRVGDGTGAPEGRARVGVVRVVELDWWTTSVNLFFPYFCFFGRQWSRIGLAEGRPGRAGKDVCIYSGRYANFRICELDWPIRNFLTSSQNLLPGLHPEIKVREPSSVCGQWSANQNRR